MQDPKDLTIAQLKDLLNTLNTSLSETNSLVASLQKQIEEFKKERRIQQEKIDYLTKKLYGPSSEKHAVEIEGQYSIFDEPEKEQTILDDKGTIVKEYVRKMKATNLEKFRGLPTEERIIELPEENRFCPECGSKLEVIGKEHVRDEMVYIPAKVKIISYYAATYGCAECNKNTDHAVILKAVCPEALIPHSYATASSVAWCMYQKYVNAMPLYRQEQDWKRIGLVLSRSTLANWIIYCAKTYFTPVYEYFHRELLRREFLMADETRVQVLKEPGRKAETDSFMWAYRSGEDGLHPITLFRYTQTRAGYNAEEFLKGFTGYLMTDGYQGYNVVPGIKRCSCLAHIRRYFVEAVPKGKENDVSEPSVQGVLYCDKLFEYERIAKEKGYTYEKRKEYRLQKEEPVLKAFFAWAEKLHTIKGTRFEKAVTYLLNRKPTMMTYLEDGRCSISNNPTESMIRPFTLGRKNWMFSDTPQGANASATVYSIVEIAKANGLNPYKYLTYLLEQRPNEKMTDEELSQMAPWAEEVQENCR